MIKMLSCGSRALTAERSLNVAGERGKVPGRSNLDQKKRTERTQSKLLGGCG
jgi:hypothetical protein